jgi:hypothetical protein
VVPRTPDFPELLPQINTFAIRGVQLQAYSAGITGNFAYSCRAVTNGTDNNVSGEMDIVVGAPAAVLFVLPLHQ